MKFHSFLSAAAIVTTASAVFSSFLAIGASAQELQTIVEIAGANPDFSTLVTALIAAELTGALSGPGPFTVFAPTNDAFAALPDGTLTSLLADPPGALTDILLYHVASGNVTSGDLTNGMIIPTLLEGKDLTVNIDIDGAVTVNGIPVITADIAASNGIIHVISGVLIPPEDIVDVASGNDIFSTLVTAVQQAGLVDTLKGDGPFTVFAPTNDAFDALPDGTLATLLAEPQGALKDILLYHVLSGEYKSTAITDGLVLETVLGEDITFSIRNGIVYVNDAKVTSVDIGASNGVIHVIDKVLIPPEDDATSSAGMEVLKHRTSLQMLLSAVSLFVAVGYDLF